MYSGGQSADGIWALSGGEVMNEKLWGTAMDIVGTSLSKPHTGVTSLHTCMHTCQPQKPNFRDRELSVKPHP